MAAYGAEMSKQLPAPKTFAPSREDVISTLGFFFGDPAVPEKLKDYSEHHAMCAPRTHPGWHTRAHCHTDRLLSTSPKTGPTTSPTPSTARTPRSARR